MEIDLTKLVIDRRKWRRGYSQSSLLNHEGKMCCLGFRAIQCGYKEDQILNTGTPYGLFKEHGLLPEFTDMLDLGDGNNSTLASSAMVINDKPYINDAERERQLTELFADHGIAITFEN